MDILKVLLEAKANMEVVDNNRLYLASSCSLSQGSIEVVKMLLEAKAKWKQWIGLASTAPSLLLFRIGKYRDSRAIARSQS